MMQEKNIFSWDTVWFVFNSQDHPIREKETFTVSLTGRRKFMSKEQKSNREGKKKPAMTAKEKKAAKKSKKESGDFLINDRSK